MPQFYFLQFRYFLLICLLSGSPAYGKTNERPVFTLKLQQAYFEIQKLRLSSASKWIEEEKKDNPSNPFVHYLENYSDLHYILISEDAAAFNRYNQLESKRLASASAIPAQSPYRLFLQAEIRLHSAFIKLKFGNNLAGSWEIIKAYRLLEENRKKFPDFLPNLKSLGLLHVLIGSIPGNYAWVADMLGMKGDIDKGLEELLLIQKKDPLFGQEAQLIYLLLHAYTLQLSADQLAIIRNWPKEHPDNLLLHFFATTVLMKENKSEEALTCLTAAPQNDSYIEFPFLHYLNAEILLQKGDYEKAYSFYRLFLKEYKGFNYLKDTNLKMFMCKWLANKDTEAAAIIKTIGKSGKTIVEADQFAKKVAEEFQEGRISARQKVLYKARFAFDGGYLNRALDLLENTSEKSFSLVAEKAEFNYRKGRILQKLGQNEKAQPYYKRCIYLAEQSARTFGASACLQMGYIALQSQQKEAAMKYFQKALSYEKHEYKNSIDNKARAALSELESEK